LKLTSMPCIDRLRGGSLRLCAGRATFCVDGTDIQRMEKAVYARYKSIYVAV
jgi:hypothetical protein